MSGAINNYTVGPTWSGARFRTIPAAVDQVLEDGHSGETAGQIVQVMVYPGRYTDDVVIPVEMPRFVLSGAGADNGTEILGDVSIDIPTTNGEFALSQLATLGDLNVSQVGGSGPSVIGRFFECQFAATNFSTQAFSWRAFDCFFLGAASWIGHVSAYLQGGRINAPYVAQCASNGATEILGAYIFGQGTFRGRSVGLTGNLIYHAGAYAIIDECTTFSEYSQNTFSRNSGPAGAPILKSGASSLTDGGNVFVDGSTYPFFEITAGSRPNRGQTDDELRNVLPVSGSQTLTRAQVGAQRKTTVVKVDGGGSVALPPRADVEPGCTVVFKDVGNATASPWSVAGDGADTIDGAPTYAISTDFASVEVQNGPSEWMVIGSYL